MNGKWVDANTDFTGKYILYCPTSPEPPKVVFDDRPTAIKASYSMARKFRGQKFLVCKIVGQTEAPPGDARYLDHGDRSDTAKVAYADAERISAAERLGLTGKMDYRNACSSLKTNPVVTEKVIPVPTSRFYNPFRR
jgi:hypothetical protein